jgi:hypothetical protein
MPSISFNPISLRYILILSFHLCLVCPNGLLPSVFPTKNMYAACHIRLSLLEIVILFSSQEQISRYFVRAYPQSSKSSCETHKRGLLLRGSCMQFIRPQQKKLNNFVTRKVVRESFGWSKNSTSFTEPRIQYHVHRSLILGSYPEPV